MLFLVTYNKDFSQVTFYYVLCDNQHKTLFQNKTIQDETKERYKVHAIANLVLHLSFLGKEIPVSFA